MLVRFSKRNGTPVLTCVREDGTTTWSKSAHGAFFGPHDLMHYAVETTLGMRQAFFGLIAAGWDIATFAERGAAARLPAEALLAEHVVNVLLQEQAAGSASEAGAFNRTLAAAMAGAPGVARLRGLTEGELSQIRERFGELLGRFRALGADGSLELPFPQESPG